MLQPVFFIKFVHTLIFFILSGCVGLVLYSAIIDRITIATWIAFALILAEGVVLILNGWRCPLSACAERLGAKSGSVSDIFLPKWFADRIFPICGTVFLLSCVLLLMRLLMR